MNLGKETETLKFKKTTSEMKEAMISIIICPTLRLGDTIFGLLTRIGRSRRKNTGGKIYLPCHSETVWSCKWR